MTRNSHDNLNTLKKEYSNNITIIYKDFLFDSFNTNFWLEFGENIVGFIHCASTFYPDTINNVNSDILKEQQLINCDIFINACNSFIQANIPCEKTPAFIAFLDSKVDKLNKSHYSYTLSKLHLFSSIKFLAMSCTPKIRVNAISPGLTFPSGEQSLLQFEKAQQSLPFGFGTSIDSIAETTDFIIKNECLVGQNIIIDAGQNLLSETDIIFKH